MYIYILNTYLFIFVYLPVITKYIINRGYRGLGKRVMSNYYLMGRVSFWTSQKILQMDSGESYTKM